MTPDEYRAAIAALGMTQGAAARFFGVNEVTGRRWCDPKGSGPPSAVATLCRLMIAKGYTPAYVAAAIELMMKVSPG